MITKHKVSIYCGSEKCHCGQIATHKIGEEIQIVPLATNEQVTNEKVLNVLMSMRHNFTAYVCCEHFNYAVRNYLPRSETDECTLPEFE